MVATISGHFTSGRLKTGAHTNQDSGQRQLPMDFRQRNPVRRQRQLNTPSPVTNASVTREYTLAQGAKRVSLSKDTLRRAINAGELKARRSTYRNQVVYAISEDDLYFYLKLRATPLPERKKAFAAFRKNGAWPANFLKKLERAPTPLPFAAEKSAAPADTAPDAHLENADNDPQRALQVSDTAREMARSPAAVQHLLNEVIFLRSLVENSRLAGH